MRINYFCYNIRLLIVILLLSSCTKEDNPDNTSNITYATGALFYKKSFNLAVGGREKIMLVLDKENAVLRNPQWSSSDTSIVKVDSLGVVYAIKAGKATVELSAYNNISDICTITTTENPIKNLVMPDPQYAIANNSMLIIEGEGFAKDCKIILYNNFDYKPVSKSPEKFYIASMQEIAESHIRACVNAEPGWYNIVLIEDENEYYLGNIEIETPALKEYQYDSTKIIWEDTHWRLFQLRGHVKTLTSSVYDNNKLTLKYTYNFNINGRIESIKKEHFDTDCDAVSAYEYGANYKYDNYNRLINLSQTTCSWDGKNKITKMSTDYYYGSHDFFIPIPLDFPNRPFSSSNFFPHFMDFHYLVIDDDLIFLYVNDVYLKGLIRVKMTDYCDSGEVREWNAYFEVSTNNAIVTMRDGEFERSYELLFNNNNLPTRIWNDYYDKTIEFSNSGIPLYEKIKYPVEYEHVDELTSYVNESPFYLLSSDNYRFGCTNNYDKNWNLVKINFGSFPTDIYYSSYDHSGNWTSCTKIEHCLSWVNLRRMTRLISYW